MKKYYAVIDYHLGIKVYLGRSEDHACEKWGPGTVLGVGWSAEEAVMKAKLKAESARRANGEGGECGT